MRAEALLRERPDVMVVYQALSRGLRGVLREERDVVQRSRWLGVVPPISHTDERRRSRGSHCATVRPGSEGSRRVRRRGIRQRPHGTYSTRSASRPPTCRRCSSRFWSEQECSNRACHHPRRERGRGKHEQAPPLRDAARSLTRLPEYLQLCTRWVSPRQQLSPLSSTYTVRACPVVPPPLIHSDRGPLASVPSGFSASRTHP